MTEAVPSVLANPAPSLVLSSCLRSETPELAFQKKNKLDPPPIKTAMFSRI